MGERPLTDEERISIEKRLLDATGRKLIIDNYVSDLEQQLKIGTVRVYEPETFKKMVKEVEEDGRKWRGQSEQREIEQYGRTLTDYERNFGIIR